MCIFFIIQTHISIKAIPPLDRVPPKALTGRFPFQSQLPQRQPFVGDLRCWRKRRGEKKGERGGDEETKERKGVNKRGDQKKWEWVRKGRKNEGEEIE